MGPGTFVTTVGNPYGAKKRLNKRFLLFVIIGLVVVIGLIITIATLAGRDNLSTESQHLSAQLTNLTTLTTDGKTHLQDDNEQKINAETEIIVDGVQANLASTLPKKVSKSIAADESNTSSTTELASAVIDGTYDSTYKQVLQQELESATATLSEMSTKTKSSTLRAQLDQSYDNLATILANLNKLS